MARATCVARSGGAHASAVPMIEVREVSRLYHRGIDLVHALERVTLGIPAGRFVALMGPSGSGKSTLLNLLAGLDQPDSGEVLVAGTRLSKLSEEELAAWRARHVGLVFQFFNLLPVLTAVENVELPLLLTKLPRADRRQRAETALSVVGLAARAHHRPAQLSGGEQQRVAIARAISKRPDVLLCDEPTGALDVHTGKVVLQAIARVNRDLGTTVAIITHNAAIGRMADRVITMKDGRIASEERNAEKASPEEIAW